jgi:hypothetical protein
MRRLFTSTLIAAMSLILAACADRDAAVQPQASTAETPTAQSEPESVLGRLVHSQTEELPKMLERQTLSLSSRDAGSQMGHIAPDGEFRIGDRIVPLDDAQRKLAAEYRRLSLAPLADTAIFAGEGMDTVTDITKTYLSGLLSGDMAEADAKAREIARKTDQRFQAICATTQARLDAQNALAAAVPEFAPYANLTQADADRCEVRETDAKPNA